MVGWVEIILVIACPPGVEWTENNVCFNDDPLRFTLIFDVKQYSFGFDKLSYIKFYIVIGEGFINPSFFRFSGGLFL